MAETDFDLDDVIRILEAIFDEPLGNPFEQIETIVTQSATDHLAWEALVDGRLDNIEARTFGILILQLVRVIRLALAIIPGGQSILIIIIIFSLIQDYFDDGSLSIETINSAIERSGLKTFLTEKLEAINAIVSDAAIQVETQTLLARDAFLALAMDSSGIESALNGVINGLGEEHSNLRVAIDSARDDLGILMLDVNAMASLASNSDLFVGAALAKIGPRIREIPRAAEDLLR